GGRVFGGTPLKIHHMPVGMGDQTAVAVLDIDPIELDLIKELPGGLEHRLHVPAPRGVRTEGAGCLALPDLSLGLVGAQPPHQGFQLVSPLRSLPVSGARRTAFQTSILGLSGRGCPVFLRFAATHYTSRPIASTPVILSLKRLVHPEYSAPLQPTDSIPDTHFCL